MAGDWIKFECTTPDKPEIDLMSRALNIDPDAVVGKLLRVWIWADQQTISGNAVSVTSSLLDRITYCPGFASAMRKVGWLEGRDESLSFPHFDRHNGHTAKNRALTKKRVAKNRNAPSVTSALPEREKEKSINREREKGAGAKRPTLEQAVQAGNQIGIRQEAVTAWWSRREASDWMRGTGAGGTTPVGSNWQADLAASRGWAEEEASKASSKPAAAKPIKKLAWE